MRAKQVGVLALLAAFSAIGAVFWLAGHVHRPLEIGQERLIVVEPGSTLNGLLRQLDQEGA